MITLICKCGMADWIIRQKKVNGIPDVKILACSTCHKEISAFILTHPKMDEGLKWK